MADPSTLAQLKELFPELEEDVLSQLLSYHQNNIEAVANALLTPESTQEQEDADLAKRMQSEMDEEAYQAPAPLVAPQQIPSENSSIPQEVTPAPNVYGERLERARAANQGSYYAQRLPPIDNPPAVPPPTQFGQLIDMTN